MKLAWKARRESETPLKVFVHANGADGKIASQADVPLNNDQWVANQVIVGSYPLQLPSSGVFTLEIGVYDEGTSKRLAVCTGQSSCQPGKDSLDLTRVDR